MSSLNVRSTPWILSAQLMAMEHVNKGNGSLKITTQKANEEKLGTSDTCTKQEMSKY